jgi:hypothetical protein
MYRESGPEKYSNAISKGQQGSKYPNKKPLTHHEAVNRLKMAWQKTMRLNINRINIEKGLKDSTRTAKRPLRLQWFSYEVKKPDTDRKEMFPFIFIVTA